MTHTETWVPGVVATPAPFDLPSDAPGLDVVISAQIIRLGAGFVLANHPLLAHAGAAVDAHAGAAVDAHAGAAVDAHTAHAHDLTIQGIAAVAAIAGTNAGFTGLEITDAGAALQTIAGAGATGVQNSVVAAHVVTQPGAHVVTQPGAHAVTQPNDHGAAAHAVTGTTPVVAAVATKVDRNTITLNVNTVLGDLIQLRYIPEGARLRVA